MLLEKEASNGTLDITNEIISELKSKHPGGAEATDSVMLTGEIPFDDPLMFENLNEGTISRAAS